MRFLKEMLRSSYVVVFYFTVYLYLSQHVVIVFGCVHGTQHEQTYLVSDIHWLLRVTTVDITAYRIFCSSRCSWMLAGQHNGVLSSLC